MQLQIRLEDVDLDAALALHRWLAEEPLVRQHGRLCWAAGAAPDRLGPGLDVLSLVLSSGFSALELLLSIAQWRASRPGAPTVVISRISPDGTTVRIEGDDLDQLTRLARELEAK